MNDTNISHFSIGLSPVHINYRLYGSIPKIEVERMAGIRQSEITAMHRRFDGLPAGLQAEVYTQEMTAIDRRHEARTERVLHATTSGPMVLADNEIRDLVIASWKYLHDRNEIVLYAICVMSNHVHVILSSLPHQEIIPIGELMSRHKTFTATKANELLNRTGKPFWAPHYFDRTIRDGKFLVAMWYVLNNPVKAKMVDHWQDWPGTYVNPLFLSHFI